MNRQNAAQLNCVRSVDSQFVGLVGDLCGGEQFHRLDHDSFVALEFRLIAQSC